MSEFLSETEGCDLLARLFRARGYAIARNLLFREYGVEFHVDGWDAKKRVGFEFLTSEDDDHDDLDLPEYQTLAAAQQRGELALFIIDEVEPLSASDLALQANEFLDEVADALRTRHNVGPASKRSALKKKPAAAKALVGKKNKKVVTKKAAAKKAAVATKPRVGKKSATKSATKRPGANAKKSAGKKAIKKKAARTR
jgi:hypothetical protein